MNIQIEQYGNKYSMELPEELTAYELLQHLTRFMLMMSYHPKSVEEAILGLAEEID